MSFVDADASLRITSKYYGSACSRAVRRIVICLRPAHAGLPASPAERVHYDAVIILLAHAARGPLVPTASQARIVVRIYFICRNLSLLRQARHVREARRPAARAPAHEALFRAAFQTNVARLTFGVLAHSSTATSTASAYLLSALYCSAPPARLISGQSPRWPPRQWLCRQAVLQYLVSHLAHVAWASCVSGTAQTAQSSRSMFYHEGFSRDGGLEASER